MTPEEFEEATKEYRIKKANVFISELPEIPESVDFLVITFHYDDGHSIKIEIGKK